MFWFVLGFIGFMVVLIFIVRNSWEDLRSKIELSVAGFILSMCFSFLLFIAASIIMSYFAQMDYTMVSDVKITALKDNQNVTGNYYIVSGCTNEDLYYYYATETELGYKVKKVSALNTYIKYADTDGETHIEKYEPRFANDVVNWFAFPKTDCKYTIYCPENTITTEFSVDLE